MQRVTIKVFLPTSGAIAGLLFAIMPEPSGPVALYFFCRAFQGVYKKLIQDEVWYNRLRNFLFVCSNNAIDCGNHVHFVCSDSSYTNSRISTLLKSVLLQVIREIPYDVVLLFTISTAITIHTGVCEPHLMRPSYTAFLNYLTDQRYLFNIFMFFNLLMYLEFCLYALSFY